MIATQIPSLGLEKAKGIPVDSPRIPKDPTEQDREVSLVELAMQIREDVADDPVFYLVRSNTFCDGE